MVTQLLLLNKRKSKVIPAPLTANTNSDNQTITLQSIGVSAATEINWGDGNTDTITGIATRTHTYATAGTYDITFDVPTNVTRIDVRDTALNVNSAGIARMVNLQSLIALSTRGVYRSADIITLFNNLARLALSPASSVVNIDTADLTEFNFTQQFRVSGLPAGATFNFNASNLQNLSGFGLDIRNNANADFTFLADGLRTYNEIDYSDLSNNNLSTAQCDAIIEEFWQQALAGTRTSLGGTINISSNSPITGTIQAPVGSPTNTGEKVYELINDSLGNGFNTWTTITVDTA